MKKVTINNSWIAFLIPICMILFMGFPQFSKLYSSYETRVDKHEKQVVKLDSLKRLNSDEFAVQHTIKMLETTVEREHKSIQQSRYMFYKMSCFIIILGITFFLIFGSSYLAKRKKNSASNKTVNFTFEDPDSDAIGQSISWDAVKSSGSNFYSQKLVKKRHGYKITSSNSMKAFPFGFFFMGLNFVIWSFIEFAESSTESLTLMKAGSLFFSSGGIFVIVGLVMFLFFGSSVFFNKQKRKLVIDGKIVPFSSIYALQLLQKFVQGNRTGGYYCYELNLVTNTGERINLLNHGDKAYILSDMMKISQFLRVPVWNYGVV